MFQRNTLRFEALKQEHAREAYRACRVECLAAAES